MITEKIYNEEMNVPVYSWASNLEESAKEQVIKLGKLSNIFHHVAFMPDAHGAGRQMSRRKAKDSFTKEQLEKELSDAGVTCFSSGDIRDEAPGAYKDIDIVMENQKDLVEIVHKLVPITTVKG